MKTDKEPPEVIYLIPDDSEFAYGPLSWVWCDDPAPAPGMDEDDAIKYIRADKKALESDD